MLQPLLPVGSGRRYLDVGCGMGHSLVVAANSNLEGVGIESSAECIEIGRRNGVDVRPVSDFPQGERFALVSFWESLEHISDPAGVLREPSE